MDEAERGALAERALAIAAVPAEAIVLHEDAALTRFTQNAIHQNVASRTTLLRVRVVLDGKTGVAQTNELHDEGVRAAVARAVELARFAPRDERFPGFSTGATNATPRGAYDPATAVASPAERARIASELIGEVERAGCWAAGFVSTGRRGVTIANTNGATRSFDGTTASLNVKANGPDASGFAEAVHTAAADLDGAAAGRNAAAKAVHGAHPVAVEPGAWTIVAEAPAFGELISYLAKHFSAQNYDEGSSFLSDGLDRAYAGPNATLLDDYAHPLLAGMPFDWQGTPTQSVTLLDRGVAAAVVTDRAWSARLGMPDTGHGGPAPDAGGPQPRNFIVAPGERPVEALIAGVARGLLVTRFWYIRPVDERKTIVTGMTRDGTFLIEDGEIRAGVRNLRFNQSIVAALGNAEFASHQHRSAGPGYDVVSPAAKIDGFRFVSITDF